MRMEIGKIIKKNSSSSFSDFGSIFKVSVQFLNFPFKLSINVVVTYLTLFKSMSRDSDAVNPLMKVTLTLMMKETENKSELVMLGQVKYRGITKMNGISSPLITSPSTICRLMI